MIVLDGTQVSKHRLAALKVENAVFEKAQGRKPGLAVMRIGDDPASKVYVGKKIKACSEVGLLSVEHHLPADISEADALALVSKLNQDPTIDGILIQLPLPKTLSETKLLEAINPNKDVDGLHPVSLGRLLAQQEGFVPCTPNGVMNLLKFYKISVEGKRAVVIGRSRIVGRPMSLLLDQAGATVTVIHSKTKNPDELLLAADIIVVAVGKPHFLKASSVREGAVVVDVGINRLETGKLAGDVDFEGV